MKQNKKETERFRFLLNKIANDTISKSELGELKKLQKAGLV